MFVIRRTRACVSAPRALFCMCVHGAHCVFARAHMCVPTGHVFVFQEDTCLLSDERVCVCVCLLRVRMYVCSFAHICVFHMYTFVSSCVHTCLFQLDTCLCFR